MSADQNQQQLIIIATVIATGVGWLRCQTSRLWGTFPEPNGDHADVPIKRCSCLYRRISADRTFIRRYAPDEPDKGDDANVA